MGFVQLGFLGALGALAIPVIIHLMFRQRSRPVDLGTLQFLKIVLRNNAKRRRLRRWLLLALRLACVALFALLFARPYLLAIEPVEGKRLVVVLLDRSASMGLKGGSRPIDRAVSEARSIVARTGRGTQLEIAAFDRAPRPLRAVDVSRNGIEPSAGGTDYSAAMAWARDLCVRSRERAKEVHVLTDLQRSGLDRGPSVTMPDDVAVSLVDLGRSFPRNVAVSDLSTAPRTIRPGDSATITATVFNASPLPASKIPVRLHLSLKSQARDLERTIDIEGGATGTVTFSLPALAEGLWKGHVEVAADDDQPFDDRRYLALSVAPPVRVLLVDGDPGRSPFESETYYLRTALRLAPSGQRYAKTPFDPRTIDLVEGASLPDLAGTDVVVLANVADLGPAASDRLREFVGRGGGLLVFTGDRLRAEGTSTLAAAGLGVGEVKGALTATETPWRLESWEASHPVFRPFEDPEHGDLRRPAFTTITRIRPDPKVRVLARFRGGEPALLERLGGRGKILWFASACDRGWGDWPRGRMFVPMVHQMLAYVSGLAEGGRVRQELAGDGQQPGTFEANGLCQVVNVDPFESETARCTPREFADRFGFRLPDPHQSQATRPGSRGATDDRLRGDEVWPWLALALIGILLLENFLANRTAA